MPEPSPATLWVVDNYDSFTYNLVQMFKAYPLQILVMRADRVAVPDAGAPVPDYLLVSPGPKDPRHAGESVPLIRHFAGRIPVLGVCLGMQCLNEAFGGRTLRAPLPVHGKTSRVFHQGKALFRGMPAGFQAARYHSLMVEVTSPELMVDATSEDGVVMGLSHPVWPLFGVQFHPESFLTEKGEVLIANFLQTGPLGRENECHDRL